MSIPLSDLVSQIVPENTVLFFGAGSSIPSGAPSVQRIIDVLSEKIQLDNGDFSLSELASISEEEIGRKELISTLRGLFKLPSVTGGLLNLPLYDWKNIYTTNYDTLIEQSYKRRERPLTVYSSNFDFGVKALPESAKLLKLHGTINQDISDGHNSRIIISESDYDNTSDYREALYISFQNDLLSSSLIIIGYSLSDAHIKEIVNKSIEINSKSINPASINLLLFEENEHRARLYERRGVKVSFGGIDGFFTELARQQKPPSIKYSFDDNPLDKNPTLNSVTIDVRHALKSITKNVSAMFQGWPASYADIKGGLTFERTQLPLVKKYILDPNNLCITLLGPSGIGKTTFARQTILSFATNDHFCWEHKSDHNLLSNLWRDIARDLHLNNKHGILFIDDAHNHLYDINTLVDLLVSEEIFNLKLIFTSAKNQWFPRIKSPNMFKYGNSVTLRKLNETEVENLLTLVETNHEIQPLLESSFSGFSRLERKRRLITKCESDTFVCLKNIFASEKFDDIVLREFAELEQNYRDIYRLVSAMESAGIKVHRQLIIRLLNIPAKNIQSSLANLTDIIHEYSISEREGIYGWKGRHPVITDIITKYKMTDEEEYFKLLEKVIDNISPTYDIEIKTIRQLCNFQSGVSRFPNKQKRNKLLRKMISIAPGERVPRHRLIRYLIDLNELEKAETEIRLFESDFKHADSPVTRFKIILKLARAENTPGILTEDRMAILEMAKDQALYAIERYPDNKNILRTYCEVGLSIFKVSGQWLTFDDAMSKMREAEDRVGDPDITNLIAKYERIGSTFEYSEPEHEGED